MRILLFSSFSTLGIRAASTPLWQSALISSSLTARGRHTERWKAPSSPIVLAEYCSLNPERTTQTQRRRPARSVSRRSGGVMISVIAAVGQWARMSFRNAVSWCGSVIQMEMSSMGVAPVRVCAIAHIKHALKIGRKVQNSAMGKSAKHGKTLEDF